MDYNSNENHNYIDGIVCDVHNCHYNEERKCNANKIQVGPQYAASTADTVCSTFRPQ